MYRRISILLASVLILSLAVAGLALGREAEGAGSAPAAQSEENVTLATARANVEIVQDGRAIVSARGNRMLVDSVPPLGGPNEEVNPMDMFLGALGTCGAFVYEAAARELEIPLHSLSVDVEADFAPAGLRDGAVNPRVRAFRAIVTADGPSMEEFEMLADAWRVRCPIYTTLERAAPIEITNLPPAQTVELGFVNHIQAGMAEADAYLLDDNGMAFRPMPDQVTDEALDMEVYKVAEMNEHDPFQVGENPTGPYAAGEPLGFTLGEWLAASGGGTYTVQGDRAWVDFAFENLAPNGVYTLWCSFIHVPPNFSIDNYPCGAADGSENVFTADEDGNASIQLALAEPKPLTTDEALSVFAIAYHSDGNTYGEDPGQFGFNSHVQLFVPMPAAEAVME